LKRNQRAIKKKTIRKIKRLAKKLAIAISKAKPFNNKVVKTAPFMILKKSEYPTMVLELGYLSNEKDRNYVNSEKGQIELAQAILSFISNINK
jgi:N-acetylmuramoyl-L-alanine amidase